MDAITVRFERISRHRVAKLASASDQSIEMRLISLDLPLQGMIHAVVSSTSVIGERKP